MSERGPRGPSDRTPPTTALRRLRLGKGETVVVRTLSSAYKGCLTHWYQGRSRYCPGKETCDLHKLESTWKGYACVEVWSQAGNLWVPEVLEISESLDQDFYGRYGPGQVWEISRKMKGPKDKSGVVTGVFWEQLKEGSVPEPYDMRPVLYSTYNRMDVVLQLDNPLPRRIMVQPSKGAPPRPPREQEAQPTQEQYQRFKAATAGMFEVPTESANGTPRKPL